MNLAKILQYSGQFPVKVKEDSYDIRKTDVKTKLSKRFLVITLLQIIVYVYRMKAFYNLDRSIRNLKIFLLQAARFLQTISFLRCLAMTKEVNLFFLKAHQILSSTSKRPKLAEYCWILISIPIYIVCYVLYFSILPSEVLLFLSHLLGDLPLLLTIIVVDLLLVITRGSYEDINQKILASAEDKFSKTSFSAAELRVLARNHWNAGDMIKSINSTFGFHIFSLMAIDLIGMACHLHNMFHQSTVFVMRSFTFVAAFILVLSTTLPLTTMSHLLDKERTKTVNLLNRLLRRKSEYLTASAKRQIQIFKIQVAARNLRLSAFGFYDINNALIFQMVMQAVAYFLIIENFKSS